MIDTVLFDLVPELISFRRDLINKLDHGRPSTLMHRIYQRSAWHLHILLAHFVVPQMYQQFVGQLLVQFEHVIERMVDHFFVVLEYVAD